MATQVDKFTSALNRFTKATKASMAAALECAELSLRHFAEHGDVSQCQAFLDAMPKNYVRRTAYLKWMMAFSPLAVEGSKLSKDKTENAVEFQVDKALEKPFWEFAPDTEILIFDANDPIVAALNAIKKFENPKKSKPASPEAAATVARIKAALDAIAPAGNIAQAA